MPLHIYFIGPSAYRSFFRGCIVIESFGARLRHERERRKIALRSVAENTKIGIHLLEGLEGDNVSRWPSGIFRKSFIRAYAEAIGLDPEPIVREFLERHPDPIPLEAAAVPAGAPPSPVNETSRWAKAVFRVLSPIPLKATIRARSPEGGITKN